MSHARHAKPRSRYAVRALLATLLGTGLAVAGAISADAYTVKPGDTLSGLGAARGVDWHLLAITNHLANPDLILIGQHLDLTGVSSIERRYYPPTPAARAYHPATRSRTTRSRTTRPSRTSSRVTLSGAWAQVARCESGGNPRAVNPSGTYRGLFQFDTRTWRSVGGSGDPAAASASEQLARAKALYAQRGASPWPSCGRYLR
jgi:hypothetical protein